MQLPPHQLQLSGPGRTLFEAMPMSRKPRSRRSTTVVAQPVLHGAAVGESRGTPGAPGGPPLSLGPLRSFSSAKPETSRSAVLSRCTQLSAFAGAANGETKNSRGSAALAALAMRAPAVPSSPSQRSHR